MQSPKVADKWVVDVATQSAFHSQSDNPQLGLIIVGAGDRHNSR